MHFSFSIAMAYAVALASANTVMFINMDSTNRTIIFTQQEGLEEVPALNCSGLSNATASFPTGWIGNFYSISEGAPNVPGMLGELRWDGWNGINWFDVSAIVNPNDCDGVKTIAPKISGSPLSGCLSYEGGCDNAYYAPDDIQTKSTTEKDLVCTIGNATTPTNTRRHQRHFAHRHSHRHVR